MALQLEFTWVGEILIVLAGFLLNNRNFRHLAQVVTYHLHLNHTTKMLATGRAKNIMPVRFMRISNILQRTTKLLMIGFQVGKK